jgi:hypothetical protein
MSGGHFDYDQYKIGQIADMVEQLIIDNDSEELNEWGDKKSRGYSKETIRAFSQGLYLLRISEIYAQRIDWLVSCDDGEDTFHRRLEEDLAAESEKA